jgi:hypothetical protein
MTVHRASFNKFLGQWTDRRGKNCAGVKAEDGGCDCDGQIEVCVENGKTASRRKANRGACGETGRTNIRLEDKSNRESGVLSRPVWLPMDYIFNNGIFSAANAALHLALLRHG